MALTMDHPGGQRSDPAAGLDEPRPDDPGVRHPWAQVLGVGPGGRSDIRVGDHGQNG